MLPLYATSTMGWDHGCSMEPKKAKNRRHEKVADSARQLRVACFGVGDPLGRGTVPKAWSMSRTMEALHLSMGLGVTAMRAVASALAWILTGARKKHTAFPTIATLATSGRHCCNTCGVRRCSCNTCGVLSVQLQHLRCFAPFCVALNAGCLFSCHLPLY